MSTHSVRSHVKETGKKLHDVLKPHTGSPYHTFRKAALAGDLISEDFSELARQISDMRDKMLHVDAEELAGVGDKAMRSFKELFGSLGKKGEIQRETLRIDADVHERPLRKVPKQEQLSSFMTGLHWYAAAIDSCFANMAPEIRVFRMLDYEV